MLFAFSPPADHLLQALGYVQNILKTTTQWNFYMKWLLGVSRGRGAKYKGAAQAFSVVLKLY